MLGTTRQRLNLIGWLTEPTKANTTPVTSRLSLYMCIGEYITLSGWEWEKNARFQGHVSLMKKTRWPYVFCFQSSNVSQWFGLLVCGL